MSSLISLFNISKWNTKKIKPVFNGHSSIIPLPPISKWKTKNSAKKNNMFNGCFNLLNL